jgi:hypothetical protein
MEGTTIKNNIKNNGTSIGLIAYFNILFNILWLLKSLYVGFTYDFKPILGSV